MSSNGINIVRIGNPFEATSTQAGLASKPGSENEQSQSQTRIVEGIKAVSGSLGKELPESTSGSPRKLEKSAKEIRLDASIANCKLKVTELQRELTEKNKQKSALPIELLKAKNHNEKKRITSQTKSLVKLIEKTEEDLKIEEGKIKEFERERATESNQEKPQDNIESPSSGSVERKEDLDVLAFVDFFETYDNPSATNDELKKLITKSGNNSIQLNSMAISLFQCGKDELGRYAISLHKSDLLRDLGLVNILDELLKISKDKDPYLAKAKKFVKNKQEFRELFVCKEYPLNDFELAIEKAEPQFESNDGEILNAFWRLLKKPGVTDTQLIELRDQLWDSKASAVRRVNMSLWLYMHGRIHDKKFVFALGKEFLVDSFKYLKEHNLSIDDILRKFIVSLLKVTGDTDFTSAKHFIGEEEEFRKLLQELGEPIEKFDAAITNAKKQLKIGVNEKEEIQAKAKLKNDEELKAKEDAELKKIAEEAEARRKADEERLKEIELVNQQPEATPPTTPPETPKPTSTKSNFSLIGFAGLIAIVCISAFAIYNRGKFPPNLASLINRVKVWH